jgi:hypothetical protein
VVFDLNGGRYLSGYAGDVVVAEEQRLVAEEARLLKHFCQASTTQRQGSNTCVSRTLTG